MTLSAAFIQPVPDDLRVGETAGWLFTAWVIVLGLLFLAYGGYRFARYRDSVPVIMWAGGAFICSFVEPMGDLVGHLWWPTNVPLTLYTAYGVEVPLLIPFAYSSFVGGGGYFAYRLIAAGITMKRLFAVFGIIAAADFIMEVPGTSTGVHVYYGNQPFEIFGFPLYWSWLNATAILSIGLFLYVLEPRVHGKWRAVLLLAPTAGHMCAWGIAMPLAFLQLNTSMAEPMRYIIAILTLPLALLIVRAIWEVIKFVRQYDAMAIAVKKRPDAVHEASR
ncbi:MULTISPECIES: hypothetical protein [unclassified Mycobacterium]|uniref:hypothetical protein n=1 Tax=unclassified Mycobacterium TaxID=2642494 RepID=UPI0007404F87|nr:MULTISPECIES: hypothetical protein [unclassified Mycobacterium]KUH83140.1 hypothetical protein AU185_05015 [Mycobacterium sp. GA-0227b]KUH84449.1 hypothetical protein AU186_21545 [Mycobacterium sp. GA-1999]KUH89414.1 hypothetical protein AU187_09880 [Mycobacterium sp. IS-1556]